MNHSNPYDDKISRGRAAGVVLVGMTLMVTVLTMMGQPLWCACGSWAPASWDIWSRHNSQHAIDPYFATHVSHGLIFCVLLWLLRKKVPRLQRFAVAVTIEGAWEILENTPLVINRYREATISLDYFGDSVVNSCFDLLACVLGYLIASVLPFRWTVVFFLALELVLLATIRDSLVINVIMLLFPIDMIRNWQAGLQPSP